MTSKERSRALDQVKTGLKKLSSGAQRLTTPDDPFAGLAESPALDQLKDPTGVLPPAELDAILAKVEEAKNSEERFAEVLSFLAKIGATAAKAMS